MGYSVQVGAFSQPRNAALLARVLKNDGLDAYYFAYKKGLYKVRFGNFATEEAARERAREAREAGAIDEYIIVSPDDYAVAFMEKYGSPYLRDEIGKTAQSFIGVPYSWGGSSRVEGFDCSGLVKAVYQLNGLDLPRSSREQFETGTPVDRGDIQKGDLVFFRTKGKLVSHVGIYAGDNRFIHAPSTGKVVALESLGNRYYAFRYAGARKYF